MSKHVIPANTNLIDGAKLGIKPGDIIAIDRAKSYSQPLHFTNVHGTSAKRIVITTEGGAVTLETGKGFSYSIKFTDCSDFKISGEIELGGGNKDSMGITCEKRTTDFEIEGLTIHTTGFAGIMGKDNTAFLGEFLLKNVKIHDCTFHDTGGEGIYLGNSATIDKATGKVNHTLRNVSIFRNNFKRTAWEPIQLGRTVSGGLIYDNVIEDYGTKNSLYQNNGIQIGEGSAGVLCYNNLIRSGTGNGIIILGSGCHAYRNRIFNAGGNGIYADDRPDTTAGFKFTDNVIVNPRAYCISVHANKGLTNEARHNMLINPKGYDAAINTNRNPFLERDHNINLVEENNYLENGPTGFRNMDLAEYFLNKL